MAYEDILFKDYKCFNKITKLEDIKQINVIIGKNNAGKSSLIDVIEYINGNNITGFENSEVCETLLLTKERIEKGFSKNTFSTTNYNTSDYEVALKYLNNRILRKITNVNGKLSFSIPSFNENYLDISSNFKKGWESVVEKNNRNFKTVKRIYAERDIKTEKDNKTISPDGKGNGITTLVKDYINISNYDEELIKKELLYKLNEIMGIDAEFEEISTQIITHTDCNEWEIYLKEKNKNRVALSKLGSGLKTILIILLYTIVIPNYENKKLDEYIFAFEEIENNLHPSLLRRVLKYIEETSEKGALFFLTTHSNVMIDAFQNNENVSFYQIKKNESHTSVDNLNNIIGKKNCLNDLGFKASDILQSNGIIWVEGPSDRIYINKWIELWSNGKYREGMNYQCLVYGGKILSDLEVSDSEINKYINILNVNKNAIVMMDSDKKSNNSRVNNTKQRIIKECEMNEIDIWVTKGREIENYIPIEIINDVFSIKTDDKFEQYEQIKNYLNRCKKGLGDKFVNNKVNNAYCLVEKMNYDNAKNIYDLDEKMKMVIKNIEKWNN